MAIRKVTEVVSTIIRRLEPGPNAKEGLPTTNKGNPTIGERRWAQSKYKEHGCHNCGSREGKGFADHIPPKSLAGDSPMKIYPSCANCSAHQGGIVSSILRGSAKILAAIAAVGSEELQAAREDPLKAIVDWSILSDIDEYILSGQPAGQGMDSLMCMQYNTSCPNQ
jgi:hypothetical protein